MGKSNLPRSGVLPGRGEPGLFLPAAAGAPLWLWAAPASSSTPDGGRRSWPPSASSSPSVLPLKTHNCRVSWEDHTHANTQPKVQLDEDWTIETPVLVWCTSLCTCRCVVLTVYWINRQICIYIYNSVWFELEIILVKKPLEMLFHHRAAWRLHCCLWFDMIYDSQESSL